MGDSFNSTKLLGNVIDELVVSSPCWHVEMFVILDTYMTGMGEGQGRKCLYIYPSVLTLALVVHLTKVKGPRRGETTAHYKKSKGAYCLHWV